MSTVSFNKQLSWRFAGGPVPNEQIYNPGDGFYWDPAGGLTRVQADGTTRMGAPVVNTFLISSAQLLALHTTPVTLIPAPYTTTATWPLSVQLNYRFGGTAYTDNGGVLTVALGAYTIGTIAGLGFWTLGADQLVNLVPPAGVVVPASQIQGQPMTLTCANNPTLGNGTMAVTVAYGLQGV